MSTTAQCTTWPPLWHVFHLELSNWIQPTYCTNLKTWRWKWHWRLCTQNIKLDLTNLILWKMYLIYLIILLYWLERIDSYSSFLWIYSDVPSICNRPSIFFFHDPIGHTHITPETLCCYSGKRFNWFSFSNDFKCFNAAVLLWYVAVHESVIQKLFPLWMNLDFQSSRETVCCALQWRCNGIVSQHQLSCTFMRPWSETELKPVWGPCLELRCLLKENQ